MDRVGLRLYFGKWDRPTLRIMLPGAFFGIVAGFLTFGMLSEDVIRILIGGIALAFTINNVLGLAARQRQAGPSVAKGMFWSAVSGLTSFLAHAGGPPAMVYMLPQRMDKVRYVATIGVFFAVVNDRINLAWFYRISQASLFVTGIQLVWQGGARYL